MAAFTAPAELESLYAGFLERNFDQSQLFVEAIAGLCRSLANHYGWSLPEDIRVEVMGETRCALLAPGARRFDSSRGTVKEFPTGFVLNAIRRLRQVLYPTLSGVNETKKANQNGASGTPARVPTLDEIDTRKDCPRVEAEWEMFTKLRVDQIVGSAAPVVQKALRAVHVEDEPLSAVATRLGVCRFKLKRDMERFVSIKRGECALRMCA